MVRYDPRGSGARHGRSRESGDDFGRRKGKVLPVGPAGQRDREGCGDAVAAGLARGRGWAGALGPVRERGKTVAGWAGRVRWKPAWEREERVGCARRERAKGRGVWAGLGPVGFVGFSSFLFLIQSKFEFKYKFEFKPHSNN